MSNSKSAAARPIIMSMHPNYAHKIVAGQKQVELRRRFPRTIKASTPVYIYATALDKSLIGRAEIAKIECLNKQDLWDKYHLAACISEADFSRYFSGLAEACALHLTTAHRFARPIPLADLRRDYGFSPPQCFIYAPDGFSAG